MSANRDALRQWSHLHDGYDVDRSRLVRGWLLMVNRLAVPLVRWKVPPDAVTLAGVAAAAAAVVAGRTAAALLVVVTALCDGLDGAVAIGRGRSSRHGTLIDHTADRVTDVLFAAALWHAGAAAWIAVTDAVMVISYETLRSLARRRDRTRALVTAGERPMRVAVTAIALAMAPAIGGAAVAMLCLVSMVQLRSGSAIRRASL